MFKFLKKNIFYISTGLVVLNLVSCLVTGFMIEYIYAFLLSGGFSILLFFLNCKIFNKGYVTEKDIFVLCGVLVVSLILLVQSFVFQASGFTILSIVTTTFFLTEFIFIKVFDIKEN